MCEASADDGGVGARTDGGAVRDRRASVVIGERESIGRLGADHAGASARAR